MYRSIVVPLDGTTFGEHALPTALDIARRCRAQLHLMHAHTDQEPGMRIRAREQDYLNGIVHRVNAVWQGVVHSNLIDEPVADALCDFATAVDADLIVMSTHARSGLARVWRGCVADEVVRHTPIPILLLRPGEAAPDLARATSLQRILIPLDGSKLAEGILARAVQLGRLTQAEYTLLQAIEPPPIESVGSDEQGLGGLRSRAQHYLEGLAEQMRAEDLPVHTDVATGEHLATAILEYALTHSIDLIAMATHGRSGLGRVLMGSVADHVIRGAQAPVLLYCPLGAA